MLNYSNSRINAVIKWEDPHLAEWFLTGVYGNPKTSHKRDTWNLIKTLCRRDDKAWFVYGDFNKILDQNEKTGGKIRLENSYRNLERCWIIVL